MISAVMLVAMVTLKLQPSALVGSMTGGAAPLKEAPKDTHSDSARPTNRPVVTPCGDNMDRSWHRFPRTRVPDSPTGLGPYPIPTNTL